MTCLAFAWSAALLAGCSTSSERRVRNPQPREDLEPVQIQLTVGLPYDSDGNGYPDTVQSLVYVFPDSRESALPIRVKGTFEFAMQNAAGDVVAHWVFPPDVTDQAARFLPAGIGYSMYLRLAPGQDVMGPTSLDVRCRFVTVDGVEVRGQGRASVRFGG
ncbi:MAG: hypothetical protein D6695_07500 [Planctomycetota bacterium]|nr:MAG: hypothetical protein D6695_07500 [Planctomycetota bacterium]